MSIGSVAMGRLIHVLYDYSILRAGTLQLVYILSYSITSNDVLSTQYLSVFYLQKLFFRALTDPFQTRDDEIQCS
jgi:hypothetical protein